jgi:hypothetical protein
MKKEDLTKKQLEEYDMILEINPQWKDKPDKIFAMIKSNAGLLEGFEESEQGQRDDYPDNFRELMNSMVGARDKTEELKDKYGEVGDFVGEEGYLEGKWGDLFNDVESSADTEEDRLRRKIRRLNEERSHVFDDEMGYMEASDPLSYHGQEQKRNLDNMREIEELVGALQRGEADMLAGTEQTFDNRDLSLVQGGIEGALPEGLQGGGLQAQVVDPGFEDLGAGRAGGFSQQQIMEALQKSQMPQDQGMDAGTMAAAAQAQEQARQMQMANRAMPQTMQYGGGQGPGTSYNRPQMYNPWQGNPQSRFQ